MSKDSYMIKKCYRDNTGKDLHVLITDGHSQVLELTTLSKAEYLVGLLNENTDNGCRYEIMVINNNKKVKK
tara:strand:+ start:536 stop:748 length:213 start_codon:yes stop_codon:yes gene_type:complete